MAINIVIENLISVLKQRKHQLEEMKCLWKKLYEVDTERKEKECHSCIGHSDDCDRYIKYLNYNKNDNREKYKDD